MRRAAALRQQGKLQEAILDLERAISDSTCSFSGATSMLIQTYNDLGVRLASQQVAPALEHSLNRLSLVFIPATHACNLSRSYALMRFVGSIAQSIWTTRTQLFSSTELTAIRLWETLPRHFPT